MSPNVGNFVHDLVEMAKAMETLPQVQAELAQAYKQNTADLETIQRLELKLMERTNEIESLNQRIRSLEVERDDAQFHALEADDRTSRALDFIKATFGNAGSLIQALEPTRPAEPVTEPAPIPAWATPEVDHTGDYIPKAEPEGLHTTQPQGQSEHPLPSANTGGTDAIDHTVNQVDVNMPINPVPAPAPSPAPEVAPAHPTATPSVPETADAPTSSPAQENAGPGPDQSFSMPPKSPGQFEGKTYSEVAKGGVYPTRAEWEANGGTIDNWYA